MYEITDAEKSELDNLFTYHKPFGDQPARYEAIRSKAKEFAVLILETVPRSADRTAALRKLRETVFTANAAIAINEKEPAVPAQVPELCKCKRDEPAPEGATCTNEGCGKIIGSLSTQAYLAPEQPSRKPEGEAQPAPAQ